jgi:hypothetical protein
MCHLSWFYLRIRDGTYPIYPYLRHAFTHSGSWRFKFWPLADTNPGSVQPLPFHKAFSHDKSSLVDEGSDVHGLYYSLRRLFTGLAIAARMDCQLTVANAMRIAMDPASAKMPKLISVR